MGYAAPESSRASNCAMGTAGSRLIQSSTVRREMPCRSDHCATVSPRRPRSALIASARDMSGFQRRDGPFGAETLSTGSVPIAAAEKHDRRLAAFDEPLAAAHAGATRPFSTRIFRGAGGITSVVAHAFAGRIGGPQGEKHGAVAVVDVHVGILAFGGSGGSAGGFDFRLHAANVEIVDAATRHRAGDDRPAMQGLGHFHRVNRGFETLCADLGVSAVEVSDLEAGGGHLVVSVSRCVTTIYGELRSGASGKMRAAKNNLRDAA